MPLTFAHPAIVLPFAKLSNRYFSLTALIIGSVILDFEYFIRLKVFSVHSHTLPGLFYYDLPLGLLFYLLFVRIVRLPLLIHLPNYVRERFDNRYKHTHWIIIVMSLLVGALSHLVWDSFTHQTGYIVQRAGVLQQHLMIGEHSFAVFKILQHGSTLVGMALIMFVIIRMPKMISPAGTRMNFFWLVVCAVVLLFILSKYLLVHSVSFGEYIVTGISGGLAGILIISVIYHVRKAGRRLVDLPVE